VRPVCVRAAIKISPACSVKIIASVRPPETMNATIPMGVRINERICSLPMTKDPPAFTILLKIQAETGLNIAVATTLKNMSKIKKFDRFMVKSLLTPDIVSAKGNLFSVVGVIDCSQYLSSPRDQKRSRNDAEFHRRYKGPKRQIHTIFSLRFYEDNEPPRAKLREIKPCGFRITLKVIRVIRVICGIETHFCLNFNILQLFLKFHYNLSHRSIKMNAIR
jgi:hypothetical protein